MKLDGREFSELDHSITATAAQNDYIIGHLRAAGALEALAGLDPTQRDATAIEKPAADFVTRIYLTGRKSFVAKRAKELAEQTAPELQEELFQ
jgi:hypothetical protein